MQQTPVISFFDNVVSFLAISMERLFLYVKPIFLNSLLRPDSVMGRSSFSISSGMVVSGVFSISALIWVIWVSVIFGFLPQFL